MEVTDYHQRLVNDLQSLLNHPGWKHLAQMMDGLIEGTSHQVVKAPDAFQMAKLVGSLATLRDIRSWPERNIRMIVAPPDQHSER